MQISSDYNRYDSAIQPSSSSLQSIANKNSGNKLFQEAYKVEFSDRAKASAEFNDPTISFPVHDSEVLQYSQSLRLTYKP
ncbi:hypothetical protein [Halarcobacter ebronensis]|uniref:Uncharacterized protein n=1 Tax=Halarcobacter ebronensis TaxID=1462615 RepID=A0A4Q1AZB6_9BACT|nr:hypothetical protein [Halarcobacter ebronensis]QKF82461.1 hypothetical protein AEBR_1982 [Halarcobacter ebronensis]RXK07518.1 hypothetical protein CRV07_03390 [Halarcobacter ebronensis]